MIAIVAISVVQGPPTLGLIVFELGSDVFGILPYSPPVWSPFDQMYCVTAKTKQYLELGADMGWYSITTEF